MLDVVALGELLIDFTANGISEKSNPLFEANPGGAPCNLLAMLSKLGKKVAFIGKVGDDMFGNQLKSALLKANISCDGLVMDKCYNTTLAFVNNKSDGDREFSFYRTNGADTKLTKHEINSKLILESKLFHFGSLSLTHDSAREATQKAISLAKEHNLVISFDPNLRVALWESMEYAKAQIIWGIKNCDILKLSEEELYFITNITNRETATETVLRSYENIKLLIITNGKHGAFAICNGIKVFCPASSHIAIDTTGAGDTFFACCLYYVLNIGIANFNEKNLDLMLKFASTAAGIITTRKGAMSVMPTFEEISEQL